MDLQESLAQVRLQYQGLSFDGWEEHTGGRTTAKNDGKTGEAQGPDIGHLTLPGSDAVSVINGKVKSKAWLSRVVH